MNRSICLFIVLSQPAITTAGCTSRSVRFLDADHLVLGSDRLQGPRRSYHIDIDDADDNDRIDPAEIRRIRVNPELPDGGWSLDPADLQGCILIEARRVTVDLEPRPGAAIDSWEQ